MSELSTGDEESAPIFEAHVLLNEQEMSKGVWRHVRSNVTKIKECMELEQDLRAGRQRPLLSAVPGKVQTTQKLRFNRPIS